MPPLPSPHHLLWENKEMQYLYILTSTPRDFYYEQFLLSATSLKLKMPNGQITLLCDSNTKKSLTDSRSGHEKIVSQTITTETPGNLSQVEVSRWLKTSMRRFVQGDFLFIDCDTIITEDLSSIENIDRNTEQRIKFGACLDKHSPIGCHNNKDFIIKNDKQLNLSSYKSNKHYNSGVIYCADSLETHKIFDRWHELWLYSKSKNITRDQPAFNNAIYENQSYFTELDGVWNCQIAYNGLPYLLESKIIHYFATDHIFVESPFLFAYEGFLKQIKETGNIPTEIFKLLENPRSAFTEHSQIIAGDDMLYVVNSNFFQFIFLLKKKCPLLFNFFNSVCSLLKIMTKNIFIMIQRRKKREINLYG